MAGSLSPWVKPQFFTSAGAPAAGYKVFTYVAGTTTKLATYTDVDLTSANTNPIVLDSAGRAVIFLQPASYKYVFAPPTDSDPPVAPIWTQDNISAVGSFGVNSDVVGVAGEYIGALSAVYLSKGESGRTAGRWYIADNTDYGFSSGAEVVGHTISEAVINAGTDFTIRLFGSVAHSLTPGLLYYVGAGGGLTPTPNPSLDLLRVVGMADASGDLIMGEKRSLDVRRIASMSVSTGNIGTGEDVLVDFVRPAGEQAVTGSSYKGFFWGATANNANAKTLRLRIIEGANNTVLMAFAPTVSELGEWTLEFEIMRNNATLGRSGVEAKVGPENGPVSRTGTNVTTNFTATWANAVTIRISGEATATDDVIIFGGNLLLVP